MAVHLNAVKIIAIFARNLSIPMMAIGHHKRAILPGLPARQSDMPDAIIIAARIIDRCVERDVVAQAEIVNVIIEILK